MRLTPSFALTTTNHAKIVLSIAEI